MKINTTTALSTPSVLLVPYSAHHVPTYHAWMQDPDLQAATASEPLSLDEEYAMQRSWREDRDKLTFIICLPRSGKMDVSDPAVRAGVDDAPDRMIGDINLFLFPSSDDANENAVIGEIELMIARKPLRRQGYGRAALLSFLHYITSNWPSISTEYIPCFKTITTIPNTPTCIAFNKACPCRKPRVVMPTNGKDTTQIAAISAQLQTYVADPGEIQSVDAGDVGFLFWRLALSNDQTTGVRKIAGVAAVYDERCDFDPTCEAVDEPPHSSRIKPLQLNAVAPLMYLRVKIQESNVGSIKLFESAGFERVSEEPNYFGEVELRRNSDGEQSSMRGNETRILPRTLLYQDREVGEHAPTQRVHLAYADSV